MTPALLAYLHLLLDLHDLIAQDRSESPGAAVIRTQMDLLEGALSPEDSGKIHGFSEFLYTLTEAN